MNKTIDNHNSRHQEPEPLINFLYNCHKPLILAGHRNPDADTLGCVLAMREVLTNLGKTVHCVALEPPKSHFRFLPGFSHLSTSAPSTHEDMVLITFDCSNREIVSLPRELEYKFDSFVNIDHHVTNTYSGALNLVMPQTSSCAEIVYLLLKKMGIEISADISTNLYAGLMFDTGRFAYSNRPETFRTAADLIESGADHWGVFSALYRHSNLNQYRLNASLIQKIERADFDPMLCHLSIPEELQENVDPEDTEDLINHISNIEDLEILVVFKYLEKSLTKVSFRSRGKYSVSDLAKELGGGGHSKAAGAIVAKGLNETRATVLQKLQQLMHDH